MHIDLKKACECFRKVRLIKEHANILCLAPGRLPVSVDDLFWVVSDMYGLKIQKKEVVYQSDRLNSLVERYADGSAIVYVKHGLDEEHQRYAATKELMHLAIDEKEDWSPDGTATLDELLAEMSVTNGTIAKNVAQSEVLADWAAAEVLYPFEFRAADKADVISQKTSIAKLSLDYNVPNFVIARSLSDWYEHIAKLVWGNVAT